jgi:hypothetical protein
MLVNDIKTDLLEVTPCMWALDIFNVGKSATTSSDKQDNDAYDSVKVVSSMGLCTRYITPYDISYVECGCCMYWTMNAREADTAYFNALSWKSNEDLEMK